MELTVFDNIIFGVLQPWQKANQNEQRFSDLLQQAGRSLPSNASELNKKLSILLQDYSGAIKHINHIDNAPLPSFLYSINFPNHFNSTTEFYLLLIHCSSMHCMQQILQDINFTSHANDAYYLVNTALKK